MTRFYDTNALLALQDEAFRENFICSDVTLRELETIKTSRAKTDEVKYRARNLSHLFDKNTDKYEIVKYEGSYTADGADKAIVSCAYHWKSIHPQEDMIFVSNDICCKNLARISGLTVESADNPIPIYRGYIEIEGTTDEINSFFDELKGDDLVCNEYVLIRNTETGDESELRFDGTALVPLKLPPSKYVKAKNQLQRCALDILNNPKITAVALLGGYGSGKTYLSMQMSLYSVREKGWQSKILGVREVVGEGKQIGYLPGDKDDKLGNFFLPLAQQLDGGEIELKSLQMQGHIETTSPYFLKGTTYNGTVILVDEAEDLNEKQIKLLGTRVGEESRIIFAGDYKQSVVDASENNGIVRMCNLLKGDPKFACIYLGEDVRSTTSKMFADLF